MWTSKEWSATLLRGSLLLLAVLGTAAAGARDDNQPCENVFTPETSAIGTIVIIRSEDVPELTPTGEIILTVSWVADVVQDPTPQSDTDTELGDEHLTYEVDSNKRTLTITVKKSLEGLTDYDPSYVNELELLYNFVSLDSSFTCNVRLMFPLTDQNTQPPTTDLDTYEGGVREDFPVHLAIPGLEVLATDLDGSPPNNELSVSFDGNCLLETEFPTYDASKGATVPILLMLKQKLDSDTMDEPVMHCSATLADHGTDPEVFTKEFAVTINIDSFPDEPPVFDQPIYNIELEQLEAPSGPLPVTPSTVHAEDGDKPPEAITYSMETITPGPWNDYFTIDANSGDVSQTKDLTEEVLQDVPVDFLVTATDASGATDDTILQIILPPAPTTTSTTTTTTPTTTTTTPTTTTTTPTTTTTSTTPTTTTPTTTTSTTPPTTTPTTTTVPTTTGVPPTTPTCPTCPPCSTTPSVTSTWSTPTASETTETASTSKTTTLNPLTTEVTCPPCSTVTPTCPTYPPTTTDIPTTCPTCPPSTTDIPTTCPTCPPFTTDIPTTCPTCPPFTTDIPNTCPTCPPCTTVIPTCPTAELASTEAGITETDPETTATGGTTATDGPETTATDGPETTATSGPGTTGTGDPVTTTATAHTETTSSVTTASVDPTGTPTESQSSTSKTTTVGLPETTASKTSDGTLSSTTTETTGPTTTEDPSGGRYVFEYQFYNFQPFTDDENVGKIRLVLEDDGITSPENVDYSWDPESSDEGNLFPLASSTGAITLSQTSAPEAGKVYLLTAVAVVDSQTITVPVQITVKAVLTCGGPYMSKGVVQRKVDERTTKDLVTFDISEDDETEDEYRICITEVSPSDYTDHFDIQNDDTLALTKAINVDAPPLLNDPVPYVTVRVQKQVIKDPQQECIAISTGGDLDRSEALVVIEVQDKNDETPSIVFPPGDSVIRVGHPTNQALGQVAGPILTLEVEDLDTVGELVYSVTGDDADQFVINTVTGDLYLPSSSSCAQTCQVTVQVTDGENEQQERDVEVYSLDLSSIFDISMPMSSTEEIEKYIKELSSTTGLDLRLLYTSLTDAPAEKHRSGGPKHRSGGPKHRSGGSVYAAHSRTVIRKSSSARAPGAAKEESTWALIVHIYGFDEGGLVTLQTLNDKLSAADEETASEFSETSTFAPDPSEPATDVVGYQVAVGVLAALLGLLLIAGIAAYVILSKKQKNAPRPAPERPAGVSTLGAAYSNMGYDGTEMGKMGSVSSKSSGNSNTFLKPQSSTSLQTSPCENDLMIEESPFRSAVDIESNLPGHQGAVVQDGTAGGGDPPYTNGGVMTGVAERKSSLHSLGGLRRIDPGPSPDGVKSSPYLSGEDGDFKASRPADTEVFSYKAYKGGEDKPDSIKLSSTYSPVYDSEEGSRRDNRTRDKRDYKDYKDPDKKDSARTKFDTSPYAFPVRSKKEPPNLSSAAPAKPIMKTMISTNAEVHSSAEGSSTTASGGFSKLKASPPLKKKSKENNDSEPEDKKSNRKLNNITSDAETTDSEMSSKKSVAFKVLVDQKQIKSRQQEEEEDKQQSDDL